MKFEDFLMKYIIILYILTLLILSVATLVVPLVLALVLSPYFYLTYIFSVLFLPVLIMLWTSLPDVL